MFLNFFNCQFCCVLLLVVLFLLLIVLGVFSVFVVVEGVVDVKIFDWVSVCVEQFVLLVSIMCLLIILQEILQFVIVISLQCLQDELLFSINDVMCNVIGVSVFFYDMQCLLYYVCGFVIIDFQVDGIFIYSGFINQEYDIVFYDCIEVIRGVNGLFSGVGVLLVMVNLLCKCFGKEFDVLFVVSVGSWDFCCMEVDVIVLLIDDGCFCSCVVVVYIDRGLYYDCYDENKMVGMVVFEGDVIDSIMVIVGYQIQDNNLIGLIWGIVLFFDNQGNFVYLLCLINLLLKWSYWKCESNIVFVNLEQCFGDNWLLKINMVYIRGNVQNVCLYGIGNLDLVIGLGIYLCVVVGDLKDICCNVDVYLIGSFLLFGCDYDFMVGVQWLDLEGIMNIVVLNFFGDWVMCVSVMGVCECCYYIFNVYFWNGDIFEVIYICIGVCCVVKIMQSGVYLVICLYLVDLLLLIVGVCLSWWEIFICFYNVVGVYIGISGVYKVSDEVILYVGLVYEIILNVLVYVSYIEIFNLQNYKDCNENLLVLVQGLNLEVGIKMQWFDGCLIVNVVVFEVKQDNYVVCDMGVLEGLFSDGILVYIGVNGIKVCGWEMDINGEILLGWMVNVGYIYVKVICVVIDLLYVNLFKDLLQFNIQLQLCGVLECLSVGGGLQW